MSKKSEKGFKIDPRQTTLTQDDAFTRKTVTPNDKASSRVTDYNFSQSFSEEEQEDESELINFSFDDYKEMQTYDAVINAEGDSIKIRAPKLWYFPTPEQGFSEHHVFFKCQTPTRKTSDKTVIPMKGMFGHLFYEKKFIQREHEILNGKINVWRIESMKGFAKLRKSGKIEQEAIEDQENFVREKVGKIQQQIADFKYCSISILNKEAITALLQLESESDHATELVFNFCRCECMHLYVKPAGRYKIDVVTRFDRDENLDFVFGKRRIDTITDNKKCNKRMKYVSIKDV